LTYSIRPAVPTDAEAIHTLIVELAIYEREPDAVTSTVDDVTESLFSERPAVFALIAEVDHEIVGIAIWFLNYSTWTGKHGVYLEDLFVRPEHRGSGIGKALLHKLAATCVAQGYTRLEWAVLDWNAPAIEFYRAMGAKPMDGWDIFRLDGDALTAFGS
jgi:GNAT superfamily N-acetyltransferase